MPAIETSHRRTVIIMIEIMDQLIMSRIVWVAQIWCIIILFHSLSRWMIMETSLWLNWVLSWLMSVFGAVVLPGDGITIVSGMGIWGIMLWRIVSSWSNSWQIVILLLIWLRWGFTGIRGVVLWLRLLFWRIRISIRLRLPHPVIMIIIYIRNGGVKLIMAWKCMRRRWKSGIAWCIRLDPRSLQRLN